MLINRALKHYKGKLSALMYNSSEKLIYFGSDDIAQPSLEALHSCFPELEAVTHYTPPTIKQDNKVADYCKKHQISTPYLKLECHSPIHKASKEERDRQWEQFNQQLAVLNPTLGVILSYGFMIPTSTIQRFRNGMIVVHPSLLPKYRGGAPIFHSILNGEKESGVSFIDISHNRFDEGNILYQVRTMLPEHKPYKDIEHHMAKVAAEYIVHVATNLQRLRPGKPQDNQEATNAPIIKDTRLNLDLPASKVYNMSRAIKQPRVRYSRLPGSEIIIALLPETQEGQGQVGQLLTLPKKKLFVRCKDKYVRIESYKEPSRGLLPAWSFVEKYMKDIKYSDLSQHRFN